MIIKKTTTTKKEKKQKTKNHLFAQHVSKSFPKIRTKAIKCC